MIWHGSYLQKALTPLANVIIYILGPAVRWTPDELQQIPYLKQILGYKKTPWTDKELFRSWVFYDRGHDWAYWEYLLLMVPFEDLPKYTHVKSLVAQDVLQHRLKIGK